MPTGRVDLGQDCFPQSCLKAYDAPICKSHSAVPVKWWHQKTLYLWSSSRQVSKQGVSAIIANTASELTLLADAGPTMELHFAWSQDQSHQEFLHLSSYSDPQTVRTHFARPVKQSYQKLTHLVAFKSLFEDTVCPFHPRKVLVCALSVDGPIFRQFSW